MTENQFIVELETALNQLPAEERNEIIQDIQEYFSNGREDGKTENDIATSLGSPTKIAEELLESSSFVESKAEIVSTNEIITIQDNLFLNVDINVQHGALFVSPSDSSMTTVELIGSNEKLKLTAEVVGDTLFIRLKSLRHWLLMFNFNMKAVTLNVIIPMKLYQSIAMKTDNGRISAEKILCKKVSVNTDNGKIQLKEIAATSLTAETDNGRIEIDKVQIDHLRAKTDNGRIEMRHVDADSIAAESDNGRIELEHVTGSIVGSTDNGRITLQTDSLDRNIDFQTDNGSIVIQSTSKPTNVSIHTKTGHGKVDVFGERNSRTVIGTGEHTIRLKSDNGRITVG
ncbi:DUF4097 family beta strand repeat protein [Sporosarcina sp. resist]|uniref:DUF4097 family beta strand repeat-containing protein n=1 Tax=Sporosarcina TaxID=1569 RepID=UPI00078E41E6|nr:MULTISPECIES: DUF4097 family beta strand repeat-containing protein [Sporosarcina]AMQ05456.1 hypothetical protein AZE41_05735 [Sporosarcina psychrophila]QNK89285.1 DUF4097 family beta strand repeat protein [Sporosarcina sp. resist]